MIHSHGHWHRGISTVLVAAAAAAAVAGCGSSSSKTTPAASKATGTGTSTSANSNVSYAQQQIDQYKAVPSFAVPGPAFNASAARGKTIFNIPEASSNPFLAAIDAGARQAVSPYGVKWVQYTTNQGTPTEWTSGMGQAITGGANVINLNSEPPLLLEPSIERAKSAGIRTVSVHLYDPAYKLPPNVAAFSLAPFDKAAQLEADWIIAKSKAHADVLIITSNDFPPSVPQRNTLLSEFRNHCGSGCKVKYVDVPSASWATKIQSQVQSSLTADPNINYIVPLYDSMAQYAAIGIQQAGHLGKTFIVTYNGTPAILKMMESGQTVVMDVGENPAAVGYAAADQDLRLLTGHQPAPKEVTGLRIIDKSNVSETGTPPKLGVGYGNAYTSGFAKLWSGK